MEDKLDLERMTLLRKELDALEKSGRSIANAELAEAVETANAAIKRCEDIAKAFKLNFSLEIDCSPDLKFYGEPQETYDSPKSTGWLSSSEFC